MSHPVTPPPLTAPLSDALADYYLALANDHQEAGK